MLAIVVRLALLALLNYYVWRRLVRDTGLRGGWRIAGTIIVIALQLPMALVILTGPGGSPTVQGAFAWPAFLGWTLFGLIFVGLLISDLLRALIWSGRKVVRRPAPTDPSRRQAIARITGGLVTTVVATEVAVGLREVLGEHRVTEEHFTLARLPAALDGFTIVQLTDIHIGGTIGRAFIEDMVRISNAQRPDLIVITGDLVDGSVAELRDAAAPLSELSAPHGVFFVTGNHEYYAGADPWIAHLGELGIRVLRNERVEISRAGAAFDLAGIDDHSAAKFGGDHGPDLARAVAGRDPARALVLLAHQPRQAHVAARHDVDLQLSGHTHGGQVWPWHYLASVQQGGLLAGRYQIGGTQLYVSRGTGYWGPPVRVGAPSEICRIVLRAAPA